MLDSDGKIRVVFLVTIIIECRPKKIKFDKTVLHDCRLIEKMLNDQIMFSKEMLSFKVRNEAHIMF